MCFPRPRPVMRWLLVVWSLIPVWVLEELLIVVKVFAATEILIRVILLRIGRNWMVIHGPVVVILSLVVSLVPVVVLEMVFLLVLQVLVSIKLIVHLASVRLESHVVLVIMVLISWRVLIWCVAAVVLLIIRFSSLLEVRIFLLILLEGLLHLVPT